MPDRIRIVGGGLAGCEAALLLAKAGIPAVLYEMRPLRATPAHETSLLGELVCSNSLRSDSPEVAVGLLKEELRLLGSSVLAAADSTRVPAGSALAVDRDAFARELTAMVEARDGLELVRREVTEFSGEGLTLLTPGPLASDSLMRSVESLVGSDRLFFFDAIAPIVDAESLDMSSLFFGARYGKGDADYLNAPLDRKGYMDFLQALLTADRVVPHGFDADDKLPLFQGCQPVEAIASSGMLSLAHGPLKPRGFRDNPLGRDLFALVQLRAENRERTAFNLVGFQTRLTQAEQRRVFRMLPGLGQASFLRYGSLHRNSYVDSPRLLREDLSFSTAPDIFVGGQFAGAEGYVESCALGFLAALFMISRIRSLPCPPPPAETALGGLYRHVTGATEVPLQPSNMHWGLLPPAQGKGKRGRRQAMVQRARIAMQEWLPALTALRP